MPKQDKFKPKLGVPFHPRYTNSAFYQTIDSITNNFNFQIEFLNWQSYESENNNLPLEYIASVDGILLPGGHYGADLKLFGSEETQDNELEFAFKK